MLVGADAAEALALLVGEAAAEALALARVDGDRVPCTAVGQPSYGRHFVSELGPTSLSMISYLNSDTIDRPTSSTRQTAQNTQKLERVHGN